MKSVSNIASSAGTGPTTTRTVNAIAGTNSVALVEMTAYQEPLIVSTYGLPGAGKSRLIGTAPSTIGVIPMEHKSRGSIIRMAQELGKKVIMPEIDMVRTGNPMLIAMLPDECVTATKFAGKNYKQEDMEKLAQREMDAISKNIKIDGEQPACCSRHYYRWHVNRCKGVAFRMAVMDEIKTIAIDTFGQFCEDTLYACYGRVDKIMPMDRKVFNSEIRDFLNAISHKHLVLTHHSSTVWKDNKPTSQTKPTNSFSKIGHYTSVAVHQERNDNPRKDKAGNLLEAQYSLTVMDCQANASLIGLELLYDSDISFSNLALAVHEESAAEDWE